MKYIKVISFLFLIWPLPVGYCNDAIVCPAMPANITQVNRDIKSDVQAQVGTFGKLKAGELAVRTEITAKNLFDKYNNADRLFVIQMMAATYCSIIKNSKSISDEEKAKLWIVFEEKAYSLIGSTPLLSANSAVEPKGKNSRAPKNQREKQTAATGDKVVVETKKESSGTVVSSQNQSGGITAHTVNINGSVNPDATNSKYSGMLEPGERVLLSVRDNALPKLEFGDGGTIFLFSGPQGKPLFQIFNDAAFTIVSKDGSVKVSTIIRNKNGKVVAELTENEWKVNKNSTFDRNYSRNALEVKDDTGDIVLQIRVLEDRIQFQGKFYDDKGNGFALGKDPSGKGGIMEFIGPNHPLLDLKIEPIFRYPSDNHLGEFR